MQEDPIVAEVRRAREALAGELGDDLDAIFRDIRERTDRGEFSEFQTIRLPPRPAEPQLGRRTGT